MTVTYKVRIGRHTEYVLVRKRHREEAHGTGVQRGRCRARLVRGTQPRSFTPFPPHFFRTLLLENIPLTLLCPISLPLHDRFLSQGIGYFTLPFLVHGKASHVHACEWNPHSVGTCCDGFSGLACMHCYALCLVCFFARFLACPPACSFCVYMFFFNRFLSIKFFQPFAHYTTSPHPLQTRSERHSRRTR